MGEPTRFEQLTQWLASVAPAPVEALHPASEDASFRRYYRLRTAGRTLIVMDAPPEKEDSRRFAALAKALAAMGLQVPQVLAAQFDQGFLLLSDLGTLPYLQALDQDRGRAEALYRDALAALLRLQAGGRDGAVEVPRYDEALLSRELALFPQWLLDRQLSLRLSRSEQAALQGVFETLTAAALAQPVVLVHRDYHSRNLMVTPENNPGVLDFQDAVYGPMSYDLVSLLRDCYIEWPLERVRSWVSDYRVRSREEGGPVVGTEQFWYWFDLMGVQRHLKAAGIFARLNIRDGKSAYLADLPRTLGYVKAVSYRYSELRALYRLITDRVEPALAQCAPS